MIEACLAGGYIADAKAYLDLAVRQDNSFAATPIFKDLEKEVALVTQ
jgi:hypothetical protein